MILRKLTIDYEYFNEVEKLHIITNYHKILIFLDFLAEKSFIISSYSKCLAT